MNWIMTRSLGKEEGYIYLAQNCLDHPGIQITMTLLLIFPSVSDLVHGNIYYKHRLLLLSVLQPHLCFFFVKSLDAQILVHFHISVSLFQFLQVYFPSFFYCMQYLVVVIFMVKPVCYAALVIFSVVSARCFTACPSTTTSSACKWHCLVLFIIVLPGLVVTFLIIFSISR